MLKSISSTMFLLVSAAAVASGSETPGAVPTSPASPSPTASPAQYQYVTKFSTTLLSGAHTDPPQVLEVAFNDRELSSGAPLSIRIFTSLNVNAVYVYVAGRMLGGVPPIEPGHFEMSGALPRLPFAVRGRTYYVRFEAQTVDGRATHVDVPVFIRQ